MTEYREKTIRGEVVQLRRIADTLDIIVAMIKKDQEDSAARQRQWNAEKK